MTLRQSIVQIESAARNLLAACEAMRLALPTEPNIIEAEQIIAFVADQYGYTFGALRDKRRDAHIVEARHLGLYLAAELANASPVALGNMLNRTHSAVICSIQSMRERIETEPQMAAKVARIRALIAARKEAA